MIPKDVKGICELFDCGVITDISEPPGFKSANPERNRVVNVFALGATPEPAAGLSGYRLTPYFFTMKALERYCASAKGRREINDKAKEIFPNDWLPDYQEWFDNICDGCFDIRGMNASEHKCHTWSGFGRKVSDYYTHKGESIKGECLCHECHPQSQERRRYGSKRDSNEHETTIGT